MNARVRAFDPAAALVDAMHVFWRQGYHATSVDSLVGATGLSRSSLYGTFGGKRELFLEALREYRAREARGLIDALAGDGDLTVTLRGIFGHTVAQARGAGAVGCLMVNTAAEFGRTDPEVAAIVRDNITEVEDALTDAIDRARGRGEIRPARPSRAIARLLFHQLTAMKLTARLVEDEAFIGDAVELALDPLGPAAGPG